MNLLDIEERVIILDYIPGSHGNFLTRVLHGLIYNQKHLTRANKSNFHGDSRVPIMGPINLRDFSQTQIFTSLPPGKTIFAPMHWSQTVVQTGNAKNLSYLNAVNDYKFIEIYFAYQNTLRYFLNWSFNITRVSREQLFNLEYFTANFYSYCVDNFMVRLFDLDHDMGIHNPATHVYTVEDITRIFEHWYAHVYFDSYTTKLGRRFLSQLNLASTVCSIEVSELYTLNNIVATIQRIKDTFNLDFVLDFDYINNEYEGLISSQISERLLDFSVPDNELHPIELGCRNFYRKQQNVHM